LHPFHRVVLFYDTDASQATKDAAQHVRNSWPGQVDLVQDMDVRSLPACVNAFSNAARAFPESVVYVGADGTSALIVAATLFAQAERKQLYYGGEIEHNPEDHLAFLDRFAFLRELPAAKIRVLRTLATTTIRTQAALAKALDLSESAISAHLENLAEDRYGSWFAEASRHGRLVLKPDLKEWLAQQPDHLDRLAGVS
jgi:biotin operon repressor